jgi:chorismate synthase
LKAFRPVLSSVRKILTTSFKRRQQGYGRGGRMAIEQDSVKILSGLRFNKTLGSR